MTRVTICCIDFGAKKCGIALSRGNLASPLKTIPNDVKALQKIVKDYGVQKFVIGWPVLPNGDEGAQCRRVEKFCQLLTQTFNLPIEKISETYSTATCLAHFDTKADHVVAYQLLENYLLSQT